MSLFPSRAIVSGLIENVEHSRNSKSCTLDQLWSVLDYLDDLIVEFFFRTDHLHLITRMVQWLDVIEAMSVVFANLTSSKHSVERSMTNFND